MFLRPIIRYCVSVESRPSSVDKYQRRTAPGSAYRRCHTACPPRICLWKSAMRTYHGRGRRTSRGTTRPRCTDGGRVSTNGARTAFPAERDGDRDSGLAIIASRHPRDACRCPRRVHQPAGACGDAGVDRGTWQSTPKLQARVMNRFTDRVRRVRSRLADASAGEVHPDVDPDRLRRGDRQVPRCAGVAHYPANRW